MGSASTLIYAASIDNAGKLIVMEDVQAPPHTTDIAGQPAAAVPAEPGCVQLRTTTTSRGSRTSTSATAPPPPAGPFGPYTQWFTDTTPTSAPFTLNARQHRHLLLPAAGQRLLEQARDLQPRGVHHRPGFHDSQPDPHRRLVDRHRLRPTSGQVSAAPPATTTTLTLTNLRGTVIGVLVTKQPGGGPIELRSNGMHEGKLATSLSAATVQKKMLLTFTLPSVQTWHARHRPDQLRHRRHRRRRRLQRQLIRTGTGRSNAGPIRL